MKAVFHTGAEVAWAEQLTATPWPLLPVANRPLIEYWIELALALGVREITTLLDHGAAAIEAYLGDGERWGVTIRYGFLRPDADPAVWLRRDPERSRGGLLWIAGPVFPRRLESFDPARIGAGVFGDDPVRGQLRIAPGGAAPAPDAGGAGAADAWQAAGLAPERMDDLGVYHRMNMALLDGEIGRYLMPGYSERERTRLGFNVIYPPGATLDPPLLAGNDVRFEPLCRVGPRVAIGSRVVVDRQTEVRDSVVLDGTYIGRNLEIVGRVVAGSRLADPADGSVIDLPDPWLLSHLEQPLRGRDVRRDLAGRAAALGLLLLLGPLHVLARLCGAPRGARPHRRRALGRRDRIVEWPEWRPLRPGLFARLSLDRVPLWVRVLAGRLWLAGGRPVAEEVRVERPYYPAVFTYADTRDDPPAIAAAMDDIDARFHARARGVREDLALCGRALWRRLTRGPPPEDPA